MTAQDAFAIAFDEAWAMDAMPGGNAPTGGGKSGGMGGTGGGAASSGIKKNAAAAQGANTSFSGGMGKQMSMAEHMERYHPDGFDPSKNKCSLFDKMVKSLESQGMSKDQAFQRAVAIHNGTNTASAPQGTQEQQPQQEIPPEQLEQMIQEFAAEMQENPAGALAKPSVETPPMEHDTAGGEVTTNSTMQAAIVEALQSSAQNGDASVQSAAEKALGQLSEITSAEPTDETKEGSEAQGAEQNGKQLEPTQPQTRTISSSSGKTSRPITAEEQQVLNEHPEREETLRSIIDIEEKAANPNLKEGELQDLADGKAQFERQFYGRDIEEPSPSAESRSPQEQKGEPRAAGRASDYIEALDKLHDAEAAFDRTRELEHGDETKIAAQKAFEDARAAVEAFEQSHVDIVDDEGNVIDTGADRRKWAEMERAMRSVGGEAPTPPNTPPNNPPNNPPEEDGGGDGPTPPNTPPNNGGDNTNVPPTPPPKPTPKPAEKPTSSAPTQASQPMQTTPSDEEFRTADGRYEVNGIKYRDLSGQGLLHGLLSAFLAGIHGEGIITGWDKISGTWDQMKRSANGENVRSGITGALLSSTIGDYANREGLSEDAKMEIDLINEMYSQAKTPSQKMSAVKEFQKWKDKYKEELGELEKPQGTQTFKPLPNDYKGTKPPLSILEKPKGFEADKDFGDKCAQAIHDRLSALGFPIEGIEKVSVGPSATTVEFKVPPTFDMTAAQSKKTRESLRGATGTDISNIEYAKGKTDVLSVQITNPEMRNVGFSDIMASEKWKQFSEKAAIPMALGRDSSGEETMLDAATMPQTIVTGATGSGKSVFISSAINSVEMAKTPDEVRIVLLDPKNEFAVQDGSPHLLFPRAGGDENKVKAGNDMANVLDSLVEIMNDRVTKIGGVVKGFDPNKNEFQGVAEHNILQYNAAHPEDKMPHILLVFDEIANARDNASAADRERIDQALRKITAVGRSVGVNCLLATQRDDVGSIPGIIQANCPGRIIFKAAPEDAKASPEAKSLAGNGDYILRDKTGKKTRGRGCYISPKEELAVPSYYRGHMTGNEDAPSEGDGGEAEEVKLPQGHLDAIEAAVKNGQPISMEAEEGFEDAFKSAFPEDWEITEEEVDGKKHWRAGPPKAPTEKPEKSAEPKLKEGYTSVPPPKDSPEFTALIKDSEGKTVGSIFRDGTRIDYTKGGVSLKPDEKAPWESDDASVGGGEEEETDWRKAANRGDAEAMLEKTRKAAEAKAWEEFNASKNSSADKAKLKKALEKANSDFEGEMELVGMKFPEEVEEGDDLEGDGGGEEPVSPEGGEDADGGEGDDEDSPAAMMKDAKAQLEAEKERIDKALAKPTLKLRERRKLRQEKIAIQQRYNEAKAKFEAGATADEILDILEPEEKPKEAQKDGETASGNTGEEGTEPTPEQIQAQKQKDEQLSASVPTPKFYNSPAFKATQRLTPKQTKEMESLLPDGWEFVTDNMFKAPARTANGVVFIRHPTNGSYGRIFIKRDEKGKEFIKPEAQIDVDTTHPEYQGYVRKEDGTYELTEEGKQAEKEAKHIRKYSKDEKARAEAQKKLNRIRYGHDEAPDNMTIVANAIMDAIAKAGM